MVPKSHFWDGNRLRRSFFTMLFSSVWSITFQLSRLELLWNMPQKAENVRNMPAKYQIYICCSTEIPWFQSSVLPPIPLIKKKMSIFSPIFNCKKAGFEPQPRSKNGRSYRKYPDFSSVPRSDLEKKHHNFVEMNFERDIEKRAY